MCVIRASPASFGGFALLGHEGIGVRDLEEEERERERGRVL